MAYFSAQYIAPFDDRSEQNIKIVVSENSDRVLIVPVDPANRHYAEIMRQVEAGELTIQEADT